MTRTGLRPVSRQTRAYFAPVDRVNGATAIFDPSKDYGFQVDSPPGPWIDLGWIENFQRTSATQIEPLTGGLAGAISVQARHGLGARIDFEFRDWGKLQMARIRPSTLSYGQISGGSSNGRPGGNWNPVLARVAERLK